MAGELPEEVAGTIERFEATLDELESALQPVLATSARDVQAQLTPLERAEMHVTLAYAANALFTMYLKTQGVKVEDHPVKREMERVQLYLSKVDRASNPNTTPTSSLNVAAVNRFITHSVPDLTTDQKSKLRAINKRERAKNEETDGKTPGRVSAKDAADAFLQGLEETGGKNKREREASRAEQPTPSKEKKKKNSSG
mmetsp:Transcript_25263/g.47770  ORF Transcript_25263/g.47770 Transcript_25263/m.47770 type:complete len:198 (+) Transcript_25263:3-596(+)